jgi:hypothetical protein
MVSSVVVVSDELPTMQVGGWGGIVRSSYISAPARSVCNLFQSRCHFHGFHVMGWEDRGVIRGRRFGTGRS